MSPTDAFPASGTVLAFEASGSIASVAVGRQGRASYRRFLSDRSAHARSLVPTIDAVLAEAGAGRGEIDGILLGAGPGSFTGVRVAASVAKGMARSLDVPLAVLSSLATAALGPEALSDVDGPWDTDPEVLGTALLEGRPRWILFDARRDRVYAGRYRLEDGRLVEEVAPHGARIGEVLGHADDPSAVFAGSGALAQRRLLEEAGRVVLPFPAGLPSADGLLLASRRRSPLVRTVDLRTWEPEYVREWGEGGTRDR